MKKVCLTIEGQPVRKSNNREFARGVLRKSDRARAYYKSFDEQVPDEARLGLEGPINIIGRLYYSPTRMIRGKRVNAKIKNATEAVNHSWVPDLSIEAIMDCLQQSGVIKDDRQVVFFGIYKGISFDNPRAELIVWESEAYETEDDGFIFEPPGADRALGVGVLS